MLFTLEALDASEGDCLLLSYGTAAKPKLMLFDGGPRKTCDESLIPRIAQVRAALSLEESEPLPIELWVVTHVDGDHIEGVLETLRRLRQARDDHRPQLLKIKEIWHNSFDDVLRTDEVASAMVYLQALPEAPPPRRGTVASIAQGRELRDAAKLFKIDVNVGFEGLVARPDDAGAVVPCGDGLSLTVIGPARRELQAYQEKWSADLRTARKTRGRVAAARLDTSDFNLASIAVLAEMGGRTMLLTGDARGDHLLEGLEAAQKLPKGNGKMKVDVMKLAHHGSAANMTQALFDRVIADTYVVSANGMHENPDEETLNRLAKARGDEPYTVVCTFREKACDFVKGDDSKAEKRRAALRNVEEWAKSQPNVAMVYRHPKARGVQVALGDEALG